MAWAVASTPGGGSAAAASNSASRSAWMCSIAASTSVLAAGEVVEHRAAGESPRPRRSSRWWRRGSRPRRRAAWPPRGCARGCGGTSACPYSCGRLIARLAAGGRYGLAHRRESPRAKRELSPAPEFTKPTSNQLIARRVASLAAQEHAQWTRTSRSAPLPQRLHLRRPPGHARLPGRAVARLHPPRLLRPALPGRRHPRRLEAEGRLVVAAGAQRRGAEDPAPGPQGRRRSSTSPATTTRWCAASSGCTSAAWWWPRTRSTSPPTAGASW